MPLKKKLKMKTLKKAELETSRNMSRVDGDNNITED